jgi:thioesterase domain-containing protein
MNAGGGGPPLFFFPGSPGSLMQLAPLAGWIRRPVPIYGVKPRGAYVGESPYERIEDLAEYAIDEIKLTAKGGPYLLVGYSAGGLVAFEIARRLSSAGASIPLLALLDTYPSEATWPIACHFEVFARQLSYRLEELQAHPPSEIKSYIRERVRGLLAYFWRSGWGRRAWQRPAPQILLQEEQRLHDATVAAALRYRPGYYGGKITFFRPREIGMRPGDPRRVWRKFAREVEIHMVSGSHGSMMDPHVETLATPLCLCLETALGGPFTSLCDTSYGA